MGFEVISYKFIAASALTAAKTLVYRMTPQRASGADLASKAATQDTGGSLVGVQPSGALGKFFETDLSLGKSESANDLKITEAVCSVSLAKNIVKTALVGLRGTVKEYISEGDYDIAISVGLVAVEDGKMVDKYPADGVEALRALLDHHEALYVDSPFLQLFNVTRLVVTDYSVEQMTHSSRQVVTIRAISDEDYTIKSNEY